MDLTALIINLVSGAVGGNAAGAALKNLSLGPVGNSIVGILGGGIGGQLLSMFGVDAGATGGDIGSIIGSVASGGVGGGALLAVVGGIKSMMGK